MTDEVCVTVTVTVGVTLTAGVTDLLGVTVAVGPAVLVGTTVLVGPTVLVGTTLLVGPTVADGNTVGLPPTDVGGAEPFAVGTNVVADADASGDDDDVQPEIAADASTATRAQPTAFSVTRSTVPVMAVRTLFRYPIGQL